MDQTKLHFPSSLSGYGQGEEDRDLRAFVPTLADLYINAGWISLKSSGPLSVETSTTLSPAPLFWLFEFINEGPQAWVISKNRSSPWVKSFLLTCSASRLNVSLQLQALGSAEREFEGLPQLRRQHFHMAIKNGHLLRQIQGAF